MNNPVVGAMVMTFHIPAAQSLKEKRRVVKSLKDKISGSFNVSVSEVGDLEKWQTASIGVCMISNDRRFMEGSFEKILALADGAPDAQITGHETQFFQ